MKKTILTSLLLISFLGHAQTSAYQFTKVIDLDKTPVISQGNTGTCWSFSTTSFLESEVHRLNGKWVDLSEMYNVRETYPKKAYNYVYRQGKAQFGEGGLSHDVLNSVKINGVVPQSDYTGIATGYTTYDHSKMIDELTQFVESIVKDPKTNLKPEWQSNFADILDRYMGVVPKTVSYEGKNYTPKEFASFLKIVPEDYVTITSFTQVPFYSTFILSIPDNFANGSYYNLPLNEYVETLDNALKAGYTVALDTDVSENTFSAQYGMAIWPNDLKSTHLFTEYLPEQEVTQASRQAMFEDYSTEDDHLMHITGLVKDQKNKPYYVVKNSWGTKGLGNDGFVYMSVPFFKAKSIAFTVHKNALNKELKKKLGLK